MQHTTVHNSIVTNRHVVSDRCTGSFKCTMNTGSILDIHLVPDTNKVYVAPNHCIKPYTAVIARDYIADDRSVGSNETIFSKLRMFIFNRKYDRHQTKFEI